MSKASAGAGRATGADTRARILAAATDLIVAGGLEAATTRSVAAAAAVQPPAIYRLFGDKERLLDEAAQSAFTAYVEKKSGRALTDDPVADLRRDWDSHVAFGLTHPEVFSLMHLNRRVVSSNAWKAGIELLAGSVRRVALVGRLLVSEERAVDLIDGAVAGAVLTLARKDPHERAELCEAAREAVFGAVFDLREPPPALSAANAALALRASLPDVPRLTSGERELLGELLLRISDDGRHEQRRRTTTEQAAAPPAPYRECRPPSEEISPVEPG